MYCICSLIFSSMCSQQYDNAFDISKWYCICKCIRMFFNFSTPCNWYQAKIKIMLVCCLPTDSRFSVQPKYFFWFPKKKNYFFPRPVPVKSGFWRFLYPGIICLCRLFYRVPDQRWENKVFFRVYKAVFASETWSVKQHDSLRKFQMERLWLPLYNWIKCLLFQLLHPSDPL